MVDDGRPGGGRRDDKLKLATADVVVVVVMFTC